MESYFEINNNQVRCHYGHKRRQYKVIISRGIWHVLWVVFLSRKVVFGITWRVEKIANRNSRETMGGNKKRIEPVSCSKWKRNEEVWRILKDGGLAVYLERLHGGDPNITRIFQKTWKEGKILVDGEYLEVTEEIVAEATGMETEGLKFYRDRVISDKAWETFPVNDKEKRRLIKIDTSYHNPKRISRPWRYVLYVLISYITMDGRFTRATGHHFMLLNHFRHKVKISFPYYLLSSLEATITSYQKDPKGDHASHQGLMLPFYEVMKTRKEARSMEKKKIKETEDTEGEEDDSMFEENTESEGEAKGLSTPIKKKKGNLKRKKKVSQEGSETEDSEEDWEVESRKQKGKAKTQKKIQIADSETEIEMGVRNKKKKQRNSQMEDSETETENEASKKEVKKRKRVEGKETRRNINTSSRRIVLTSDEEEETPDNRKMKKTEDRQNEKEELEIKKRELKTDINKEDVCMDQNKDGDSGLMENPLNMEERGHEKKINKDIIDDFSGFIKIIYNDQVTLKKQVEKTQEEMKILNSMGIGDKTVADCLKEMKEVVGNSEAQVEYAKKVESMEKQVKQIKDNMEKDNRDEDIKSLHKKVKRLEATVKKIGEQCLISLKAYCGHAQILMDKLEVINKEKDSSVVEKMGPGSRTRASARKKSPKDDKETEELKTSVNNMQLMVLEAEEMVKEM